MCNYTSFPGSLLFPRYPEEDEKESRAPGKEVVHPSFQQNVEKLPGCMIWCS